MYDVSYYSKDIIKMECEKNEYMYSKHLKISINAHAQEMHALLVLYDNSQKINSEFIKPVLETLVNGLLSKIQAEAREYENTQKNDDTIFKEHENNFVKSVSSERYDIAGHNPPPMETSVVQSSQTVNTKLGYTDKVYCNRWFKSFPK